MDILVVVGREKDVALEREVGAAGRRFVTSPQPDRGQLSSLLAALDVLENEQGVEAMMVLPVD